MLFSTRKQESLLRQSFLNRLKTKVLKNDGAVKQKIHRSTSDLSEIGERERAWSLPSERELTKYLGPVDECLVQNAEIARRNRRKRTDHRRYSVQLEPSTNMDGKARAANIFPSKYFPPKQTLFNIVRCKWCEPIQQPTSLERDDSDDETYIDDNGIYTTVLCFTEI